MNLPGRTAIPVEIRAANAAEAWRRPAREPSPRDRFDLAHPRASSFVFADTVIGETDDGEVWADVEVFFNYTPECRGSFTGGLQNEPDVAAEVEVLAVFDAATGAEIEMDDARLSQDSLAAMVWKRMEGR